MQGQTRRTASVRTNTHEHPECCPPPRGDRRASLPTFQSPGVPDTGDGSTERTPTFSLPKGSKEASVPAGEALSSHGQRQSPTGLRLHASWACAWAASAWPLPSHAGRAAPCGADRSPFSPCRQRGKRPGRQLGPAAEGGRGFQDTQAKPSWARRLAKSQLGLTGAAVLAFSNGVCR